MNLAHMHRALLVSMHFLDVLDKDCLIDKRPHFNYTDEIYGGEGAIYM